PETCRPGSLPPRHWLDWSGLVHTLRTPAVGPLVLTFFLATFAFGGMESTLALVNQLLLTGDVQRGLGLAREALEGSGVEQKNFLIFAYIGVVLMVVQGGIYRRMVQKVGEVRFLRLGVCLMALGLLGGVAVLLEREQFETVTPRVLAALAVFTV